MIYFSILLFVATVGMAGVWKALSRKELELADGKEGDRSEGVGRASWLARLITCLAGGLATALLLFSGLTVVGAGQVGVPVIFGSVQPYSIPEGIHFINPFASVHEMSVRTESYTMVAHPVEGAKPGDDSVFAQSKDGIVLFLDATIAYKLNENGAAWVYRHLGPDYVESILRPAARSAIPDATGMYRYEEAYSLKREELNEKIAERARFRLQEIISKYPNPPVEPLQVQQFMIRKIEPPASLKASIEQKAAAEQDALRMTYVLQRESQEAERKRVEAKGIRDFQEIVSQGISDKLLEWKGIEATELLAKSPNAKVVIIGGGKSGLPLILNP